jgi:hypothetical protein
MKTYDRTTLGGKTFFHGDCSVESDRVDGAVTPVLLKAADICHTLAPHTGLFLVSIVVLV